LHIYGKALRPGRKVGHVTLRADSAEQLATRMEQLPRFFHRQEFCLTPNLVTSAK
jgi:5-(carboxyamino)imidazole ribonucleotide synthase